MNGRVMTILAILIVSASMLTLGCTSVSGTGSTQATATPGPGDSSTDNGSRSMPPGFNGTSGHDFNGTHPDFNGTYPGRGFNGSSNGTYPRRDFNGTPPDFNQTMMNPNDAPGNTGNSG